MIIKNMKNEGTVAILQLNKFNKILKEDIKEQMFY